MTNTQIFHGQRFHVEADSEGNHYVTRLADAQVISFVGDVLGNQVFEKNKRDLDDDVIRFYAVNYGWFR